MKKASSFFPNSESSENYENSDSSEAASVIEQLLAEFVTHLRYELNRSPLTVREYQRDIRQLLAYLSEQDLLPDNSLIGLTETSLRGWLGELARQGAAPSTLRRKAQSLRALYHFLQQTERKEGNPAAALVLPRLPVRLPEFVSEKEMEQISATPRDEDTATDFTAVRDNLVVTLLYSTGIRQAELLGLSDKDADTRSGELRVLGKRNKQRIVPLAPQLCQLIDHYRQLRDETYPEREADTLFVNKGRPLRKTKLFEIVRQELQVASSHKKSPHVLRHTFATTMLNNGADINIVKEFLGHASLQTTQLYTHLSFAELRRNYNSSHPRAAKKSTKDDT